MHIVSYHIHAVRCFEGEERNRQETIATLTHGKRLRGRSDKFRGKELTAQMEFGCFLLTSLSMLSMPSFAITTPIRKIIKNLLHFFFFLIIHGVKVPKENKNSCMLLEYKFLPAWQFVGINKLSFLP